MSSGVSEQMSAAELLSQASSAEQANEGAVRANGGENDPVLYASISWSFYPMCEVAVG